MSKNIQLLQGNEASAAGAIYCGCDFFGGYPITPSTEVAEEMARLLEDELVLGPKAGLAAKKVAQRAVTP